MLHLHTMSYFTWTKCSHLSKPGNAIFFYLIKLWTEPNLTDWITFLQGLQQQQLSKCQSERKPGTRFSFFFSGWKMEKVLTSSPKCFMAYSRTPDAASGCCSLLLMLKEMTKQWQTVRPIWTQNRGFQSFTVKHEDMQVLSKKKDKAKGHRLENMTWMYKSQSQEVPAKTSMLLNEANQHTTSH